MTERDASYWRERERDALRRSRQAANPLVRAYWRWRADGFLAKHAAYEGYRAVSG